MARKAIHYAAFRVNDEQLSTQLTGNCMYYSVGMDQKPPGKYYSYQPAQEPLRLVLTPIYSCIITKFKHTNTFCDKHSPCHVITTILVL